MKIELADLIVLEGGTSQNFAQKHNSWVRLLKNLEAAHPVNYFPQFLGKNIKNCPPSKLFLFTSLVKMCCIGWGYTQEDMLTHPFVLSHTGKTHFYLLVNVSLISLCSSTYTYNQHNIWTIKHIWDLFQQTERQVAKFHLKVISRFMMFRL